ncbi:hypothetical protein [Chromohalobacter nigrandesensis]|uniref:hypothetical protein n=1 Tax=Chromohalobacter nigrandesensis TaxID=119863 RepID=UPI001FF3A00D|nr:hypothetical protein [Chromohalobacter nigrandesensis]MCK0743567.1 hypothetical protein [Chromohalobacter nigrandesensis]
MNADTQITLDSLHQAVLDAITAAFPAIKTVEDYPDDRQRIQVPAALVELTELAAVPDDDPGTGQLALEAQFELRYVLGWRGVNQGRAIRAQVAALAHFIHQQQWGLPVEPARVAVCEPDEFSPELDQYLVWRIDWSQIVHIGENEWIDDGTPPTEVWVGVSPLIGPEHEAFYTRQDGSQYEEEGGS